MGSDETDCIFVVIAIDRLVDAQTTTMDFHIENWDENFSHRNHHYHGNHSNGSVLQAMAVGSKLSARASDVETPQNSSLQ